VRLGRCPDCRHDMVLVDVHRCGCGLRYTELRHTKIAQKRDCPQPIVVTAVRAHECGRHLRPLNAHALEGKSA
jgi:hypothetical protein